MFPRGGGMTHPGGLHGGAPRSVRRRKEQRESRWFHGKARQDKVSRHRPG